MKIKAFILTVAIIFSAFTLASCEKKVKDREYNEQEVIAAAKELIKKSEKLNEIYYGHGIECDTSDENNANGYYYPADILSCEKFGIHTINELKAFTRECFTVTQSDLMINNTLSPIRDTNGDIIHFARYYQEYNTLDTSEEKCIMVYSEYEPLLTDKVEYLYDTVRVHDVEGEIITVAIDVKVEKVDNGVLQRLQMATTIYVNLLEESNGFRIDSPTYVKFNTQHERFNSPTYEINPQN